MRTSTWTIRRGTSDDACVIAAHRVRMMVEIGSMRADEGAQLEDEAGRWLTDGIARGEYRAWLAVADDGAAVGGAGVQVRPIIPRPAPGGGVLSGMQGLVVNVWVEPEWRRLGIAEALMREVVADAESSGLANLVLHASDAGRALYERLGFVATNEMRLDMRGRA